MTQALAIEPVIDRAPASWRRTTFKALLRPVEQRRGHVSDLDLLSLSSQGHLYPRSLVGDRQPPAEESLPRYLVVAPGDLVVNPMWLTGGSIAISDRAGLVSPDYRVFRRRRHDVEPRFLHHVVRMPAALAQYQLYTRAATTFDRRVQQDDLDGLPISLPSLDEQRRIADFLDDQVARLDAAAAMARHLRGAVDLRLTAAWADAYEACRAGGPLVPLRRVIASIVDGPFGSGLTSAHYTDSGTRVIRLGNIGVAHFRPEATAFISPAYAAELRQHAALPGDVVMAGLGDDRWPLGRATVVPAGLGPAIVKADCYRLRPRRGILPEYLASALSAPQTQESVRLLSRGSTRARLNTEVAREVPVALVGGQEQGDLIRTVQRAQGDHAAQATLLGRQLDLLEERKRALITACVTGEFDVSTASARAGDAALAHLPAGVGAGPVGGARQ
jgi:type I restriction enzyme S subunit